MVGEFFANSPINPPTTSPDNIKIKNTHIFFSLVAIFFSSFQNLILVQFFLRLFIFASNVLYIELVFFSSKICYFNKK